MDILEGVLLAGHLIGVALIVGTFLVQLRAKEGFRVDLILIGGIVQLVTGLALYGLAQNHAHPKLIVHAILGLAVVAAAIAAFVIARRGGRVKGAFHAAGGLGIVNLLVAAIWPWSLG